MTKTHEIVNKYPTSNNSNTRPAREKDRMKRRKLKDKSEKSE